MSDKSADEFHHNPNACNHEKTGEKIVHEWKDRFGHECRIINTTDYHLFQHYIAGSWHAPPDQYTTEADEIARLAERNKNLQEILDAVEKIGPELDKRIAELEAGAEAAKELLRNNSPLLKNIFTHDDILTASQRATKKAAISILGLKEAGYLNDWRP